MKLHDVIALLQDLRTRHFENGQAMHLYRGQIGSVVVTHEDGDCEVEFSDREGRPFAILSPHPVN